MIEEFIEAAERDRAKLLSGLALPPWAMTAEEVWAASAEERARWGEPVYGPGEPPF